MSEPTRVLLVEDHPIVAEGLQLALGRHDEFRVVGTAVTVAEAARLATELQPSVVLLDYHLPDGTGADAARIIRNAVPHAALVMLSADASDEAMLASIEAGVSGYVVKSEAAAEIASAVRRAAAGEMLIPASTLVGLLGRQRQRAYKAARRTELSERLTPRETEVLQLMARGIDNRAIVDELGISLATVRVHVQNIIEKLGAHSRLEAVIRANEYGLVRS